MFKLYTLASLAKSPRFIIVHWFTLFTVVSLCIFLTNASAKILKQTKINNFYTVKSLLFKADVESNCIWQKNQF